MDEELFLEVWTLFRVYIPEKDRVNAAMSLIDAFEGCGHDVETFMEIIATDNDIDAALVEKGYLSEELDDVDEYEDA